MCSWKMGPILAIPVDSRGGYPGRGELNFGGRLRAVFGGGLLYCAFWLVFRAFACVTWKGSMLLGYLMLQCSFGREVGRLACGAQVFLLKWGYGQGLPLFHVLIAQQVVPFKVGR